MRIAAWNGRGLGVDLTVRRLKEINRRFLPDILCLAETKQRDDYVRDKVCELGYIVSHGWLTGGLVVL